MSDNSKFKPKVIWKDKISTYTGSATCRVVRNERGVLKAEHRSGHDCLGVERWAQITNKDLESLAWAEALKAELKKRKVRIK